MGTALVRREDDTGNQEIKLGDKVFTQEEIRRMMQGASAEDAAKVIEGIAQTLTLYASTAAPPIIRELILFADYLGIGASEALTSILIDWIGLAHYAEFREQIVPEIQKRLKFLYTGSRNRPAEHLIVSSERIKKGVRAHADRAERNDIQLEAFIVPHNQRVNMEWFWRAREPQFAGSTGAHVGIWGPQGKIFETGKVVQPRFTFDPDTYSDSGTGTLELDAGLYLISATCGGNSRAEIEVEAEAILSERKSFAPFALGAIALGLFAISAQQQG